jgi:hypothetical protein
VPQTTIKYQHGIPLLKATERLVGLAFIRTANDDRKNTDAAFLTFNVNRPVNVYIFYSDSATTGPDWLTGAFTPTPASRPHASITPGTCAGRICSR